jgi:hypothetical protein
MYLLKHELTHDTDNEKHERIREARGRTRNENELRTSNTNRQLAANL